MGIGTGAGGVIPPQHDDIWTRIRELEKTVQRALSFAASAQAVSTQLAANVAALAASGTTWAGPVNSPAGTNVQAGQDLVAGRNVSAPSGTVSASALSLTGGSSVGGNETVGGTFNVTGAASFPQAYNNPVSIGTYYAAYLEGTTYRLGRTASSRRYKQDIDPISVPVDAIVALQLVQFRWKSQVAEHGDEVGYDFGMIAEQLHDLGLTPWVFYDDEGRPEGIHYDRFALALLPVVQMLVQHVQGLEARLRAE